PGMIRDFGISPTAMGSIYSAFILGYGLLMIPGGLFTDKLGSRRTLTLMGFCSALVTGLTVVGPGLGALIGIVPALFAIRFGLGVVTAPLYPACTQVIARLTPVALHGRVQGIIIAGSSFGAAISPLLFTWIVASFEWWAPFLIAALATAALAAAWYGSAPDYPVTLETHVAHLWKGVFRNRNLLLITY